MMNELVGLGRLAEPVEERLARLSKEDVPRRIWSRDHTVWRDDPTEIADRLGWLTLHEDMREPVAELVGLDREYESEGIRNAVLCGMGGSSLAPEVFREILGVAPGALDLAVLDSTHPDQIVALDRSLDLQRTVFVIASKSGTTTETLSHLEHYWSLVPDGSHFVAITDPGTPLEDLAKERGFRHTFRARPDVGGRYSALTHFGLVNAALIGAGLDELLDGAAAMAEACGPDVPADRNPGCVLGAILGEAHNAGRDKLTLVLPDGWRAFGYWVEQLIAESTGKDGKGILPVEGEDLADPGAYGEDRVFVSTRGAGGPELEALERAGHPVVRLQPEHGLGAEMFRWEFATAVAGAVLRIQPFDQPDVQSAKDATKRILDSGEIPDPDPGDLGGLFASIRPGDYLSIQAYLPRNRATERHLHDIRLDLRDRLRVATTVGFGPRFLHSTGQLHKGGSNTGAFVQVVEPPVADVEIPGKLYSFGALLAAQAAGDLLALRDRGRRVVRVPTSQLEQA